MSKYQRTKGHNWERECAKKLNAIGFKGVKRHLETQIAEAELGRDLDNTYPLAIQCKNLASGISPHKLLSQIKDTPGEYKVGMLKITRKGEYAIMHLEEFLELIQMLKKENII